MNHEARLRAAIEAAVRGEPVLPNLSKRAAVAIEHDVIDLDAPPAWAEPYQLAAIRGCSGRPQDPDQRSLLVDVVSHIVRVEAPITIDLIARRVADAWQVNRTKHVLTVTREIVELLARDGHWRVILGAYVERQGKVKVRVPTRTDADTKREIADIPPPERAEAVYRLVADAIAANRDQIMTAVRGLFGFSRLGATIEAALDDALDELVEKGRLTLGEDSLYRVGVVAD